MPLAHALLGGSLVAALHTQPRQRRFWWSLFVGAVFANAADFDFLLVFALHSKAWHRGFTHSLVFALLIYLLIAVGLGRRRWKEALAFGLAFASHGVLDNVTSKVGGGVELFWPFASDRLILGWQGLSEVPSKMTTVEILQALALELALFAPPLIALLVWRRARAQRETAVEVGHVR